LLLFHPIDKDSFTHLKRLIRQKQGGNRLRIAAITVRLYAPWVHSLKEKRMEVKSLTARIRNKFNVSVAETDAQDIQKTIVIGVASITANSAQGDGIIDTVLAFIETNTEADITSVERMLF
jgi:uncharacterized protein